MKTILSFFCAIIVFHCAAQSGINRRMYGTYEYKQKEKYMGIGFLNVSLTLQEAGTFIYNEYRERSNNHSKGIWQCNKDTLILINSPDRNHIPFNVIESVSPNEDSVNIGLVNNLDSELMSAIYYLNGDTNNQCEPLMRTGCKLQLGQLDSFMLDLSYGAKTEWYRIKNKNATNMQVVVNTHETFANFTFFDEKKYLIKNNQLIDLSYKIVLKK